VVATSMGAIVRNWPPPGRKDRRKPSAAHWAAADLPAEQIPALPLAQQRNSCPYRAPRLARASCPRRTLARSPEPISQRPVSLRRDPERSEATRGELNAPVSGPFRARGLRNCRPLPRTGSKPLRPPHILHELPIAPAYKPFRRSGERCSTPSMGPHLAMHARKLTPRGRHGVTG